MAAHPADDQVSVAEAAAGAGHTGAFHVSEVIESVLEWPDSPPLI